MESAAASSAVDAERRSREGGGARRARGRPRKFDRQSALEAALRVFWTHGYEGASVTELTEAMGINRPSLYAAFGNKESLFRFVLQLYEKRQLAYVDGALSAPTAREVAEQLLRGALKAYCGASGPKGCLGVIASVAGGVDSDQIRRHILARRVESDALLANRFDRARREGDIPHDIDPTSLAMLVWAIMQGVAVQAGGGASYSELSRMVETGLRLWPTA